MTSTIPAETKLAAKRGFIRTAAQSLATSFVIPAGVTLAFTQEALLAAAVGVAGVIVGAGVNGLQSYFDIISRGIPDDYQPSTGDHAA
ncbi:hypothetical protein [Leucobacter japonicus]|uniref:hypothetical protein n=1 Tax=Leucobacter japonicus TaxID=1461259 RepID=UPI0006A7E2FC|nr:hypothetical protein [Leucobacter japonicus]